MPSHDADPPLARSAPASPSHAANPSNTASPTNTASPSSPASPSGVPAAGALRGFAAPSPSNHAAVRRARWAVSLIFFLNGTSFCAILPRYPELVEHLELSKAAFGLAVGLGPIGGLLAGLLAARLMRTIGSGRTAIAFQILASTSHLLVYISSSWLWLALALMISSAVDAITDIAMNAHGMRVERRYRRSIMNSFHGFWSLGAVSGGLLGAGAAQIGMALWLQGLLGLVLFAALALVAHSMILPGPDFTEREIASPAAASAQDIPADPVPTGRMVAGASLRGLALILALGMMLVFAGSVEDAASTWGALFMGTAYGVGPFVAGLALVAMQAAQMTGRFLGDRIVDRLGDRTTARLGALITAAGMSLALLIPHPVIAIVGFAAAGWGVATLFPAAFRAADDMPGVPHGVGITLVGWLARIGFFLSPPVVGALADQLGLHRALWLVPLYALGILIFSGALAQRRSGQESAPAASTEHAGR